MERFIIIQVYNDKLIIIIFFNLIKIFTFFYIIVIDPFSATIGVGLGLPEFKPGLAEKNLIKEAILASESQHIEEAMLNDKLRMTDWERTEEELSKQVKYYFF